MADYKRFVSYMYEYVDGVKKKNVGYVRVEIRNGECKFTISMRAQSLMEGIFPTYLIHRPSDHMTLIYIGDSIAKNQTMNSRLNSREINLMNSGHDFTDVGGMLLFLSSGIFYATQWDDKPVVMEEVLKALKPSLKKESRHIIDKPDKKEDKRIHGDKDKAETKADVDKGKAESKVDVDKGKTESKADIDKEEADYKADKDKEKVDYKVDVDKAKVDYKVDVDKEKVDKTDVGKEKIDYAAHAGEEGIVDGISSDIKEPATQRADKSEERPIRQADKPIYMLPGGWRTDKSLIPNQGKPPLNPWEQVAKYRNYESKNAQNINLAQKGQDEKDQTSKEQKAKDKDIVMDKKKDQEAEPRVLKSAGKKEEENAQAEKLFDSHPRIYPFEDNMISRCIKMEPKDIGRLPSELWSLSNNSFLMHGFYCYNHIIVAEIKDQYGCHYIIGVPGIYHNRERFMARMFGFECFKPIRKRDLKQGDFGYWYVEFKF